jgi:hypothetical protein
MGNCVSEPEAQQTFERPVVLIKDRAMFHDGAYETWGSDMILMG